MSGSGTPIDMIGPGSDSESPRSDEVELFGRELECAEISRLLEQAHGSRSSVLVLRGEAGVGKSALLAFAMRSASEMRILRVVGVEPESELAFAALHQLLRPVFPYIDRIPDVQGQALRIAMGIAPGIVENRFVIALAVLSLLGEVVVGGPVLCLIDDVQWLDQPSADALAFVARRLEAEGIVMLFSAREGDLGSFPGAGLPYRTVGGLDPVDAERLLVGRFGADLAPEVRRLIIGSAEGLPLALLEIPAGLTAAQQSGHEALPRPMPMGHQLQEILLGRVHRLESSAQMLLLVVAAEGSGDADVILSAAATLGIPPSILLDTESSGLIRMDGTGLVFRHPILRSAIYQQASPPQRQAVHRALVGVLQGEINADRRAWHRAALVLYPDDEIADELERTAERARARGAYAAACDALRRSAELTSAGGHRARRLVAAARAAWDAGLPDEAIVLLRTIETEHDPQIFAEARHVQGEIELNCGIPLRGAAALLEGAGRVARTDPHKALAMLFDAALCAGYGADTDMVLEAGRMASTLPLDGSEPDASLVDIFVGAIAMLYTKDARVRAKLLRTLDRVIDVTEPRQLNWAGVAAALVGDQAKDDAFRRRSEAVSRGSLAVGSLAMVLSRMAWANLFDSGRIAAASTYAEEGLQLALEARLTNPACLHRSVLAWIAAVRGDEEACTSLAEQASKTATEHGLAFHNSTANWAVALLHLGLGRWDDAAVRLESVWSAAPGLGHPHVAMRALPDLVEAAVRAGRLDLAESAAARFAESVGEGGRDALMALSTRCRALVAHPSEAKGKLLSEALVLHDRDPRPFDRARTLLLHGEHLRRERRRTEARVPLRTALDAFEQLDAAPWAARAERELRATGQTVRRRDVPSSVELTPQERRVAELVAEGATNKEVAAQLFLSPHTVEYHLRNVFTKLAISSRAELRPRLEEASSNRTA